MAGLNGGYYSPDTHTLLNIRGCDTLSKTHDKFGNLFDVDDILVLLVGAFLALSGASRVYGASSCRCIRVHRDDLGTARDLQGVLLSHTLPVNGKVPQVGRGKPSVGLLDPYMVEAQNQDMYRLLSEKAHTKLLVYALLHILDLLLNLLQSRGIWSLSLWLR